MKKRQIIPIGVSALVLIFILFSTLGGGSKITLDCTPVADKSVQPAKVHLKVYVENSGSMNGYMCAGSNLKDAVYDYVSDLCKLTSASSFFYINSQIIRCNQALVTYIQDLTPESFARAGGNMANTDLRKIISDILRNHKKNDVSVFVSDCILDIPQNAVNFFGNCQVSIKNSFIEALRADPSLGVEIIRLQSKFDGYWYCGANKELLRGVKRPYYIWVIGNKYVLANLNKKAPVKDILGGIENYCAFSPSDQIPFDIDKKRYIVNHTGVVNVQLLANLSYSLQDESVIQSPLSYTSANPANVKVVDAKPITANYSKYSHVIDVELTNPKTIKSESITFVYPGLPAWVSEFNDNTGTNVRSNLSKTTGLLYLVRGVSEAYKGNTVYGNITFNIHK